MNSRRCARRHDQPAVGRAREGRDGCARSRGASSVLTGFTSILSDGAMAWMTANRLVPERWAGSRSTAARVKLGAISLSNSSHFPPAAVFEGQESGDIATRPRQAVDEAATDRIASDREHDRHRAGRLQQGVYGRGAVGQDDVGRERYQFRRVPANIVRHRSGPARVDSHVATDSPARFLQPLQERRRCGA